MSESKIGPQRGPSSSAKIQAETKATKKELAEYISKQLGIDFKEDDILHIVQTNKVRSLRERFDAWWESRYVNSGWGLAEKALAFDAFQHGYAAGKNQLDQPNSRCCAKCGGSGTVQRWTGEYVECDACDARGF
jgi:hypothetical protein